MSLYSSSYFITLDVMLNVPVISICSKCVIGFVNLEVLTRVSGSGLSYMAL